MAFVCDGDGLDGVFVALPVQHPNAGTDGNVTIDVAFVPGQAVTNKDMK